MVGGDLLNRYGNPVTQHWAALLQTSERIVHLYRIKACSHGISF